MRRSASEATVGDLVTLLRIVRAFWPGARGNVNRLPIHTYAILLAVARQPEGSTMRELRTAFALSHSSVTRTCLAMARADLVQIGRAPEDRRRKFVRLTQRGHRIIDEVLAAFRGSDF